MEEPSVQPEKRGATVLAALWRYKFWWLAPLVLFAGLLALFFLTNYASAPFHYTVM